MGMFDGHRSPPPPAGSDEAQQDVAQASDSKAEATDELPMDDIEAVAGLNADCAPLRDYCIRIPDTTYRAPPSTYRAPTYRAPTYRPPPRPPPPPNQKRGANHAYDMTDNNQTEAQHQI
jgi:hypothetical protein